MFLGKDGEQRTECRKMQCRYFFVELSRQEENISLATLVFLPIPQEIKLRQHLCNARPTSVLYRNSTAHSFTAKLPFLSTSENAKTDWKTIEAREDKRRGGNMEKRKHRPIPPDTTSIEYCNCRKGRYLLKDRSLGRRPSKQPVFGSVPWVVASFEKKEEQGQEDAGRQGQTTRPDKRTRQQTARRREPGTTEPEGKARQQNQDKQAQHTKGQAPHAGGRQTREPGNFHPV